jgi:hypothetical protein
MGYERGFKHRLQIANGVPHGVAAVRAKMLEASLPY